MSNDYNTPNHLEQLNLPKADHDDDAFSPNPLYYHVNTTGFITLLRISGKRGLVVADCQGIEVVIPAKIIRVVGDDKQVWIHANILASILDKAGFDGFGLVEDMGYEF